MLHIAFSQDTQKTVCHDMLHCTDFYGNIVSWQIVGENVQCNIGLRLHGAIFDARDLDEKPSIEYITT